MANETQQQLVTLRSQILDELVSYSDQLLQNDNVGYDALLAIAHVRADASLLPTVLNKIHAIEDESTRADALLDLLNEVELQMSYSDQPAEATEQTESDVTDIEQHDGSSVQYHGEDQDQQPQHDQL